MGFLDQLTTQVNNLIGRETKDNNGLAAGAKTLAESLYTSDSERVKNDTQITTAVDSMFFNFPSLNVQDSFRNFNYQFAIWKADQSGDIPLLHLTLPLNPQAISVSVPTAVNTTVTMKGITEEHNGAPLRQISITGTTGVYNIAQAFNTDSAPGNGTLDYLFANTIQAAGRVVERVNNIKEAFSSETLPSESPLVDDPIPEGSHVATGYTVIQNLQRFFDLYLDAKAAGGANNNLFLSFYMEKDQQYYDCTLTNYTIRKNPGTLEYNYSISLTAWRRRKNKVGGGGREAVGNIGTTAASNDPNYFARINKGLDDARKVVSDSIGVLRGVDADIDRNVLQPIKKIGLLGKDLANARKTMADYPDSLVNRAKAVIQSGWGKAKEDKNKQKTMARIGKKLEKKNIQSRRVDNLRLNQSPIDEAAVIDSNFNTGSDSPDRLRETVDPLNTIFDNPAENQDVLSAFDIEELELTADIQSQISAADEAARNITVVELEEAKANLEEFLALYENTLGGGNPTYNRIFGIPNSSTTRILTVDNVDFFRTLNNAAMSIDKLIRTRRDSTPTASEDYARYYANYAITQGLDFQENISKFYIPFPLGASLPQLAKQYLGNQDRWLEIAAINALKSPYIDEAGKEVPFIASGAGNTFFVQSSQELYVGQIVRLSSDTVKAETRKITAIDLISEIQTIIAVDGEGDLSKLRVADNAKMEYYLPNTVNSNMLIAIPSDVPVNAPGNLRLNPSLQDLSNIDRIARTDFYLQYNNGQQTADITMVGGDIKTASGYHNLVQAAELKVRTQQGDLLHDTSFGNPVQVGNSASEVNAQFILQQMADIFSEDPRFGALIASRAFVGSGAIVMDLLVPVNNSDAYLPFTTSLPRNA